MINDNIDEIYNLISQSTFCVKTLSNRLYLLFFKPLIEKYLNDTTKNYYIFVSTNNKFLPLYQNYWPTHPRLIYTENNLIPHVQSNIDCIYFYHNSHKPSKEDQINLVSHVTAYPLLKYVFVGDIGNLLSFTRIKLFRYYLHFEKHASKWGRLRSGGIINYAISKLVCRKYYNQIEKKKKVINSFTLYDYFIFHDIQMEQSKIYRFNKKIFKPKNKKIVKTPAIVDNNGKNMVVKYIYTDIRNDPVHLIMPDGTKEIFKDVVKKYSDIIEI